MSALSQEQMSVVDALFKQHIGHVTVRAAGDKPLRATVLFTGGSGKDFMSKFKPLEEMGFNVDGYRIKGDGNGYAEIKLPMWAAGV
ncbi:MAG: hypothetical protein MPK62_02330 [Alphaproteobacteria bacterium]|nr:hypothetical protein [Alphaproteobacteria bacterium]MDA8029972.1 hypothetical protein [Alphaproteobacteria bacterium]